MATALHYNSSSSTKLQKYGHATFLAYSGGRVDVNVWIS